MTRRVFTEVAFHFNNDPAGDPLVAAANQPMPKQMRRNLLGARQEKGAGHGTEARRLQCGWRHRSAFFRCLTEACNCFNKAPGAFCFACIFSLALSNAKTMVSSASRLCLLERARCSATCASKVP